VSVTPKDIYAVGDTLLKAAGEANERSAISRYYYAAYHRCRQWEATLPALGHSLMGPKGGTHQQFVNALNWPDSKCSVDQQKKSKKLGSKLDILRIRRRAADYEIAVQLSAGESTSQQQQVQSMLDYCDQQP